MVILIGRVPLKVPIDLNLSIFQLLLSVIFGSGFLSLRLAMIILWSPMIGVKVFMLVIEVESLV